MRIAMIDPSLFTLPYDQALATGLVHAGHAVAIHGRRPGPDDSSPPGVPLEETFYRLANSGPAMRLPRPAQRALKGFDHAWSMGRLLARLRRDRPDVIHFQWLPLPLVDRPMLGLFRRIAPLVLTVHDTNPFNGDRALRLQAAGFFGCLGLFPKLIVHTAQGEARLVARGVAPERLTVLPHGPMAMTRHSPVPDDMLGKLTFVLFGKIKDYKGADVLIEAFAALPEALRRQARVRIVGKPYMDLAPLEALLATHSLAGDGPGQIAIEPRFVADAEVPELFGPGAVAMFPYREIDTSGVLPQALAQARPVVATRLGVFAETLTDGVHGHLVPMDDAPALTKALAHLIEDRAFAAACSHNARALSDATDSWDTIAERTAAIYRAAGAADRGAADRGAMRGAADANRVPPGARRATVMSNSTRNSTGGNC